MRIAHLASIALALYACGDGAPAVVPGGVDVASPPTMSEDGVERALPRDEKGAPLVVFLGDSLSAGYGLSEDAAFPALLARRFAAAGRPFRLVNAGVSGDTTAGGLRRLDWLLQQSPDVVVVELGANDGLRGLPLELTRASLHEILTRIEGAGSRSLLLGMLVPPNYGPDYAEGFARIFPELADELGTPLVPFLLAGVGGRPELNLADGIHPTAAGHEILADNVEPYLREVLGGLATPRVPSPPATARPSLPESRP